MQLVYRVAEHQHSKAAQMMRVLQDNCVPCRIRSNMHYWDVLVSNANYEKAARISYSQQWARP